MCNGNWRQPPDFTSLGPRREGFARSDPPQLVDVVEDFGVGSEGRQLLEQKGKLPIILPEDFDRKAVDRSVEVEQPRRRLRPDSPENHLLSRPRARDNQGSVPDPRQIWCEHRLCRG